MIMFLEKLVEGAGDWSHVGMVISKEWVPNLNVDDPTGKKLYLWESNASSTLAVINKDPTLDAESNTGLIGVQVRDLADVLGDDTKLGIKIGLGKLYHNPIDQITGEGDAAYAARTAQLKSLLATIHTKYYHRTYQFNPVRLCAAIFPCCEYLACNCCFGKKWVYCSQLVSIIYKHIGILPVDWDAKAVSPEELAQSSKIIAVPTLLN
jgi:hypothetical protein